MLNADPDILFASKSEWIMYLKSLKDDFSILADVLGIAILPVNSM